VRQHVKVHQRNIYGKNLVKFAADGRKGGKGSGKGISGWDPQTSTERKGPLADYETRLVGMLLWGEEDLK